MLHRLWRPFTRGRGRAEKRLLRPPLRRGCGDLTPDGVILQHAPGRVSRCDFDQMAMPGLAGEIALIQAFADTRVIGLTINHENMTDVEVETAIVRYEMQLGIPVTDALTRSTERLVDMVLAAFPVLEEELALAVT